MRICHGNVRDLNKANTNCPPQIGTALRQAQPTVSKSPIVLIEPRRFIRECLTKGIEDACSQNVIALASVDEWMKASININASLLLLSGLDSSDWDAFLINAQALSRACGFVPVVILSDDREFVRRLAGSPDCELAGIIPTDMPLDLAMQALQLIRSGVTLISPMASKNDQETQIDQSGKPLDLLFTARQIEVLEALRQGKANKTIACELQLQESTVKVHVRNIMKKLKAKNRTEVAYIVSNHHKYDNNRTLTPL